MNLQEQLAETEAQAQRLRQQIASATCAEAGHDWQSLGGCNAGCADWCCCSVPVHECRRCGDSDYGGNEWADEVRRECAALKGDDLTPAQVEEFEYALAAGAKEEWRPCPGYEGLYEVSSLGRVKTLGDRAGRVRILATGPDQEGYPMVPLTKNKRRTCKTVHRLVALAFHGDERNALHCEVAHLDNDRTNARADNLKWVSKVENRAHRRMHGTHDQGERNANAKLTDDAVREIRSYPPYKIDMRALAEKYGVSRRTIESARRGQNWRHVECEASQSGPKGNAQKRSAPTNTAQPTGQSPNKDSPHA